MYWKVELVILLGMIYLAFQNGSLF